MMHSICKETAKKLVLLAIVSAFLYVFAACSAPIPKINPSKSAELKESPQVEENLNYDESQKMKYYIFDTSTDNMDSGNIRYGLISSDGEEILPVNYGMIQRLNINGRANADITRNSLLYVSEGLKRIVRGDTLETDEELHEAYNKAQRERGAAFATGNGELLTEFDYCSHIDPKVLSNDLIAVCSKNQKELIILRYPSMDKLVSIDAKDDIERGPQLFNEGKTLAFFDSGKVIMYDMEAIEEGRVRVSGQIANVTFELETETNAEQKLLIASKDDKMGALDSHGRWQIEAEYKDIEYSGGVYILTKTAETETDADAVDEEIGNGDNNETDNNETEAETDETALRSNEEAVEPEEEMSEDEAETEAEMETEAEISKAGEDENAEYYDDYAEKKLLYAAIDGEGKEEILALEERRINSHFDGHFIIEESDDEENSSSKTYIMDAKSGKAISRKYSSIEDFADNEEYTTAFKNADENGAVIIDRAGNEIDVADGILSNDIDSLEIFNDEFILCKLSNGHCFAYNIKTKEMLIEPERYDYINRLYDSGDRDNVFFVVLEGSELNFSRYALLDRDGNLVQNNVNYLKYCDGNRILVSKGFFSGMMNMEGDWLWKISNFTSLED